MAKIAKKYQDQLKRIKKNIENSHQYFKGNNERFNRFKRFVFDTSLTDDDLSVTQALKRPQIELNTQEAYISRLLGEYYKQEPAIEVTSGNPESMDPALPMIIEGHIRAIFDEANNSDNTQWRIYKDQLAGGFSNLEIYTEYPDPYSFQPVIRMSRVYDPTMCGFDVLTKETHKGDSNYCYKLYPKTKEEFQQDYPDVDLTNINFSRSIDEFSWSYNQSDRDIIVLAEYYEKKRRKLKIVQLVNGKVMTADQYEQFIEQWQMSSQIEQPPAIKDARYTYTTLICRYILIQDQIIDYDETIFDKLPIIFADGNSEDIVNGNSGTTGQMTRPYVYHTVGVQKLRNLTVQTLANEMENLVQHKFMAAKEGIPPEYKDAYINVQEANVLVYNAYKDDDVNKPVPPPTAVPRLPIPPEITGTIGMCDQLNQVILGSYDASLGANNQQAISGKAIEMGATNSNAAAMPYLVNNMQALTRAAQVIVDIIPKLYVTPATIPIKLPDGKRSFVKINQPGGIDINYTENSLNVKVEAGVSFAIQKSRALQQIIALMQASPLFAQFINAEGLPILLDNLEIRGADQLKKGSEKFMQEMKQQQQQQQQMAQQMAQQQMQNNPAVMRNKIDMAKLQATVQQDQAENQLKAAEIGIDKQNADNDRLKILAQLQSQHQTDLVQLEKAQTERYAHGVDLALKVADQSHRHGKEASEFIHKVLKETPTNSQI